MTHYFWFLEICYFLHSEHHKWSAVSLYTLEKAGISTEDIVKAEHSKGTEEKETCFDLGVNCPFKIWARHTSITVEKQEYSHMSDRQNGTELWLGYQAGFGQETLQEHFQGSSWSTQFRTSVVLILLSVQLSSFSFLNLFLALFQHFVGH